MLFYEIKHLDLSNMGIYCFQSLKALYYTNVCTIENEYKAG